MKETKKNPVGRPTSYKPEYCKQMLDFFLSFLDVDKQKKPEFPTLMDFAREVEVNYATLTRWRDAHPDFRKAYKECQEVQLNIVIKNAIVGRFNSIFSIFTLKNIAGWRDSPVIDNSTHNHFNIQKIAKGYNGNGSRSGDSQSRIDVLK